MSRLCLLCRFVNECIPLFDLDVSSSPGASSVTLAHNLTSGAGGSDPDLIVLGFQELDLSTEALLYATSTTKEDAWAAAIFAGLGEKGILYEKVSCFLLFLCCDIMSNACQLASKQLVGMLIIAIVKKSRLSCFSDITLSAAGAGIMGVMVGTFVSILSVALSISSCREIKVQQRYECCIHLQLQKSRRVPQCSLSSTHILQHLMK